MTTRPQLLYYGPDASRIERRCASQEVPFVADSIAPGDELASLSDRPHFDCVLCIDAGDTDVAGLLEMVRARSDRVPIVVARVGDGNGDADHRDLVRECDVTHSLSVRSDADPVGLLSDLSPLLERAVDRRREQSMLDSLLANLPMSVYFKDLDSRHVTVSDAMPRMIGPPYIENAEGKRHHVPADIVGKTDFDLYDEELAESAIGDDRSVIESERPIIDRIEHSYGELGTGTYVATSKAPWYDDGRLVGILGITRDISERKGYEYQLKRQNERLERFATMVSHDIRNPLSVAVGRLDAARQSGASEHFDAIERSLERIESLVEDILRVTRQGESVMDPEPVSLAEVASEAWAIVDDESATCEIRTDAEILAEPGRLKELLENLFRNAVEHGTVDGDTSELTITVDDLPTADGFYVADDGTGVPRNRQDAIFEPGISEANSTGIGLSLVASIANAHNWTIEFSESEAGGTRFEFRGVREPFEE